MDKRLFIYRSKTDPTLIEAVGNYMQSLGGRMENERTIALLYAPRRCFLALTDHNGNFIDEEGGAIKPADVFEARVFNSVAELRWLNVAEGKGRAAVLSEDGLLNFFGDQPQAEKDVADCINQRYLLWGKSAGKQSDDGWSQFATARIGSYWVPLPSVKHKGCAQFTAREYLKEYKDGNICVAEERLTGLVQVDARKDAEKKESVDG